ncbi:MAG TPA: hypothetical protein VFO63_20095 [Blastocatellia bacterium]|nr:hypothetical protein [Blastocatellia bacterium]
MERELIQREGSLFYAQAYRRMVAIASIIYLLVGSAVALAGANRLENTLAGAALFGIVIAQIATVWLVYAIVLWVFKREASQTVEITSEGIRETRNGREFVFLPWSGVKQIEIAATIVAGASLRVKGNFSEISISNVDLVITRRQRITEMHRALGETARMRKLLEKLKTAAPHAAVEMNRLARRRLNKQPWAEGKAPT